MLDTGDRARESSVDKFELVCLNTEDEEDGVVVAMLLCVFITGSFVAEWVVAVEVAAGDVAGGVVAAGVTV